MLRQHFAKMTGGVIIKLHTIHTILCYFDTLLCFTLLAGVDFTHILCTIVVSTQTNLKVFKTTIIQSMYRDEHRYECVHCHCKPIMTLYTAAGTFALLSSHSLISNMLKKDEVPLG